MNLDSHTFGGHPKRTDPRHAQQIRQGGKKADLIHQTAETHHKAAEIPAAEAELEKELGQIKNNRQKS